MPSCSPPVTFWSGRRPGGVTVMNAKLRFGFCPFAHPRATKIFLTTHAPQGRWPPWNPGTNSMLLTNVPGSTQWAAVRTRFSLGLSTTLAVQNCVTPPLVVKNRAPTVGTPLKSVAEGVPGGGLIAGPAVKGTGAGVAAAIREGVQSARAVCCADEVTVCTTPISGCEPAVDAAAITAAAGAAATTASTNTVLTVQRPYPLPH